MKIFICLKWSGILGLVFLIAASAAGQTNAAPLSIGVYDSRAVAYAHFSSVASQKALREQIATAKAARAAGDDAKYKEYAAALRAKQDQIHRQAFSTAPVDDALAAIKNRLPEIQKQAGVSVLVSKWDEPTLLKYKDASRVDVTDQLVREFIQPTEQQLKAISALEKSKPLSLEECDELIRKGQI